MIRRIGPVESVATGAVDAHGSAHRPDPGGRDRRDHGPRGTDPHLLETLHGRSPGGVFLNDATARYPAVVLGRRPRQRLGITRGQTSPSGIGERWFTVVGILEPSASRRELDAAALVGLPGGGEPVRAPTGPPGTVYVRSDQAAVTAVRGGPRRRPPTRRTRTRSPGSPAVGRARGPGRGGDGVHRAVPGPRGRRPARRRRRDRQRDADVGPRAAGRDRAPARARGDARATSRSSSWPSRSAFALLGGLLGVGVGIAVSVAYATFQGWIVVIPPVAPVVGLASALVVGALAGLYPSLRAARVSPTEALRGT